jgi:hypothetical protein
MDETYPEPFGEALSHSSQRAAQMTSLFIALTQAFTQYRARHEQQQAARDQTAAAGLAAREHAARQQAQAAWAAALDPAWLAQADLLQAARVWGAAMPYAPADPTAAAAMGRCEDRMTGLHPYAMARYSRLRAEGASPYEAMRQAAPLFAYHPDPRPGHPATARHPLDAAPATSQPAAPGRPAAAPARRSPAALAAENFPHTVGDAVRAGAAAAAHAGAPAARRTAARPLRHPRRAR